MFGQTGIVESFQTSQYWPAIFSKSKLYRVYLQPQFSKKTQLYSWSRYIVEVPIVPRNHSILLRVQRNYSIFLLLPKKSVLMTDSMKFGVSQQLGTTQFKFLLRPLLYRVLHVYLDDFFVIRIRKSFRYKRRTL